MCEFCGFEVSIIPAVRIVLGDLQSPVSVVSQRRIRWRKGWKSASRATCAILSAITNDGKTTPSSLGSFIGIDGAAITRHLDRLEEQGLLVRERGTADRRVVHLKLTRKGSRLVPKLVADSKATNAKFLAGLTSAEQKKLHEVAASSRPQTCWSGTSSSGGRPVGRGLAEPLPDGRYDTGRTCSLWPRPMSSLGGLWFRRVSIPRQPPEGRTTIPEDIV